MDSYISLLAIFLLTGRKGLRILLQQSNTYLIYILINFVC